MSHVSFREVARNTSIRTRFKSLTALELNKSEIIKRAAYVVASAYVREIKPKKKALAKRQLRKLIGLSIIFIKYDFYDPIYRQFRHNLGFDDVSL